ncbi:hypothetical protein TUM4644_26180 [Shewanella colwelliana]|nr:hypothetical protein TUM4644_26180 [Shewanella colwelliana]
MSLATAIYSRTRDRDVELAFVYGYILSNWLLDRDIVVSHPWPLNENIHVFDTLSRIYTGLLTLFDLTSFDTVHEVLADI